MSLAVRRALGGERVLDPKRALDLALGSLLLVLAAPALAAAAAALALRGAASPARPPATGGRILARELRVGLGGRPFVVRSLRTRRGRLDLLSRLPHVVSGRMSLVGPAPLPVGTPRAAAAWRQSVRPGLTGLAQVRRSSRMPWDESALLDLHYVEHHWIGTDLLVLLRTPAASVARDGGRRTPGTPAPQRIPRARRRAHGVGAGALPGLRARPGSRTARARVAPSDTDHRVRRYIAAR